VSLFRWSETGQLDPSCEAHQIGIVKVTVRRTPSRPRIHGRDADVYVAAPARCPVSKWANPRLPIHTAIDSNCAAQAPKASSTQRQPACCGVGDGWGGGEAMDRSLTIWRQRAHDEMLTPTRFSVVERRNTCRPGNLHGTVVSPPFIGKSQMTNVAGKNSRLRQWGTRRLGRPLGCLCRSLQATAPSGACRRGLAPVGLAPSAACTRRAQHPPIRSVYAHHNTHAATECAPTKHHCAIPMTAAALADRKSQVPWQAPQYFPFERSSMVISVVPAAIGKSFRVAALAGSQRVWGGRAESHRHSAL